MKGLKRVGMVSLALLVSLFLATGAMARMGGDKGGAKMNNTPFSQDQRQCKRLNILEGNPVTVTGVVAESDEWARGVNIDTGAEVVTVYGIGPVKLWEELDVPMPAVGDEITANAYEVTFRDDTVKLIAGSVVVNGTTVQLIDEETGAPLWKRRSGKGEPINILEGEPFEITGVISETGNNGRSVSIDSDGEVVLVYGLGPAYYWEESGFVKPGVGDEVTVSGYALTFSDGNVRNIAVSVTLGDDELLLRDLETGKPLWFKRRPAPEPEEEI